MNSTQARIPKRKFARPSGWFEPIEDVSVKTEAQKRADKFVRDNQKKADEERKRLLKERAIHEAAESIAKAKKLDSVSEAPKECTPAELAVHEQVKAKVSSLVKEAEAKVAESVKNRDAKAEAPHTEPVFEDTKPFCIVEPVEGTSDSKRSSGGGGNGQFPPKSNGGGSGGNFSRQPYPLRLIGWNILFVCITIGLLVFNLTNGDDAKNAYKAVALKVDSLATDIAYGAKRFDLFSEKLAKSQSEILNNKASIHTLEGKTSKQEDAINRIQTAVKILADSVVDSRSFAENADKLSHIEKEINALRRDDVRSLAAIKKLTSAIEEIRAEFKADSNQTSNAIAQLRTEIVALKANEATVPQPSGAKGLQSPQKGSIAGNVRLSEHVVGADGFIRLASFTKPEKATNNSPSEAQLAQEERIKKAFNSHQVDVLSLNLE